MTVARICAFIVLAVSGLFAFRYFSAEPASLPTEIPRQAPIIVFNNVSGAAIETKAAQASVANDESAACLTIEQIEAHPAFAKFTSAFEPLLVDVPA
jgi:hypothetical protein